MKTFSYIFLVAGIILLIANIVYMLKHTSVKKNEAHNKKSNKISYILLITAILMIFLGGILFAVQMNHQSHTASDDKTQLSVTASTQPTQKNSNSHETDSSKETKDPNVNEKNVEDKLRDEFEKTYGSKNYSITHQGTKYMITVWGEGATTDVLDKAFKNNEDLDTSWQTWIDGAKQATLANNVWLNAQGVKNPSTEFKFVDFNDHNKIIFDICDGNVISDYVTTIENSAKNTEE